MAIDVEDVGEASIPPKSAGAGPGKGSDGGRATIATEPFARLVSNQPEAGDRAIAGPTPSRRSQGSPLASVAQLLITRVSKKKVAFFACARINALRMRAAIPVPTNVRFDLAMSMGSPAGNLG